MGPVEPRRSPPSVRRHQLLAIRASGTPPRLRAAPALILPLTLALLLPCTYAINSARAQCIDYNDYIHVEASIDMPAPVADVAIVGDYAYAICQWYGLYILDISDPASPQQIGWADAPEAAENTRLATDGSFAYVTNGSRLHVFDVTAPTFPVLIATLDLQDYLGGLALGGTYAYLGAGSRLHVIDVADPAEPHEVASLEVLDQITDIALSSPHAYLSGQGLHIVDIADPLSPALLGSYPTEEIMASVAARGAHAYLLGEYALLALDVSNPAAPVVVDQRYVYDMLELEIAGKHLFIGGRYTSLLTLDLSDPANPEPVGGLTTGGFGSGVAVSDIYAICAEREPGRLHVIDATNAASPPTSGADLSNWSQDIDVLGGLAYVAVGIGGIRILDVSNPDNPNLVGALDTPGGAKSIAVRSGYAYVGDSDMGLQIIDVTDPAYPEIVGNVDTPHDAQGVFLSGDLAFVADGYSGLQVIDITDPSSPRIIASLDTPNYAYDLVVRGDYAFMASGGFQVVDVSDPTDPRIVASLDALRYCYGISVDGNLAFVAHHFDGLQVIDISDPTTPVSLSHLRMPGFTEGVTARGGYAFVASYEAGMQVVDVSSPHEPVIIGTLDTALLMEEVCVEGSYAYIVDGATGLIIAPAQCNRAPTISSLDSTDTIISTAPNPGPGWTSIRVNLPTAQAVKLSVFDVTGRLVRVLHQGLLSGGPQEIRWDGRDARGRAAGTGTYWIRILTPQTRASIRQVLVR